jgi:hypothetical protein
VHTQLGTGLLESVYETCLYYELKEIGLKVERQVGLPVKHKNLSLDSGLKLGLLINFNEVRLKHGLRRIANNMHKSNSFQ